VECRLAGIAHAKVAEPHSYRGRKPSFGREQLDTIRDMLAQGASPTMIAEAAEVSRQVVYRVQDDPEGEAVLSEWGM
jgi:putative DNA-invertase from lambdoid prophage Rac